MNSQEFINEFTRILQIQQIDLNWSMNSFEFIHKFNWIYQQIYLKYLQIFRKYYSFSLFGFFLENRQWIHKWIHKRLANSFEFIKEFIWLNQWIYFDLSTDLIQIQLIFCDWHTLWLLETPDLVDYKTEKFNSWKKSSMNSFLIILFKFLLFFRHVANFFYQIY